MEPLNIPPPPRRVRLISFWKDPVFLGLGLAGLIFVLISVIQGVVFTWLARPWIDWTLDRSARLTPGVLVSSEVVQREHYGTLHPTRFVYRFEFGVGEHIETIEGRSKSLDPHRVAVGAGGEVRVQYHPDRPRWNRLEESRFSLFPRWALLVPYAMFPAGLLMLFFGLRGRARQRRLLEHGEEATGTVLAVRRLWYKKNKRTRQIARRVSFEHSHPHGERRTSHTDTFNEELADALNPGAPIRLLVLRDDPDRALALDLNPGFELLS